MCVDFSPIYFCSRVIKFIAFCLDALWRWVRRIGALLCVTKDFMHALYAGNITPRLRVDFIVGFKVDEHQDCALRLRTVLAHCGCAPFELLSSELLLIYFAIPSVWRDSKRSTHCARPCLCVVRSSLCACIDRCAVKTRCRICTYTAWILFCRIFSVMQLCGCLHMQVWTTSRTR